MDYQRAIHKKEIKAHLFAIYWCGWETVHTQLY